MDDSAISDRDKNGFMSAVYNLDRSKGLDIILHTPGGDLAAAESLVSYLRSLFGKDIRAIIPQIAMSAGTMIACSCKCLIMGKQSNIGPIDPHVRGLSAFGVIEEFEKAKKDIKKEPHCLPLWQIIIGKYPPAILGECEKAVQWSHDLIEDWLGSNMFADDPSTSGVIATIIERLGNPKETKSHSRHIGIEDCVQLGLRVERLEVLIDGKDLQDAVLSVHHAYMVTLDAFPTIGKIVENHEGAMMLIRGGDQR